MVVAHGQTSAAAAVEAVERLGNCWCSGDQADLTDTASTERSERLGLLHQDDLNFRSLMRAQHAELAHGGVLRPATFELQLFGQGLAEPHVDRSLDLSFAEFRMDGPTHIVRRHDSFDLAALFVEHHDLGGKAE